MKIAKGISQGQDVGVVSCSSYRKGEKGWLACAGSWLFFRSHSSVREEKKKIFILDKVSLQETGVLDKFQSADVEYGPIFGDGSLLYSVKR